MKQRLLSIAVFSFWAAFSLAQNSIPVPPAIEGTNFDLVLQHGVSEIFTGIQTSTIGYNGSQLGPTLIFQKGSTVSLNVHNQLGDTTTTHWHGLHVAARNDGSPHNMIMPGETWSPGFEVMDDAATFWYHPHPHGKTLNQVVKGAAGFIIVRDNEEALLNLPRTYGVDDVPLVFQWKTFDSVKQIVELDEQDNEVLINGVLRGGTLNLPAQVVRLRLLNGSAHRFFDFGFANALGFKQIAGDAGLLDAPVSLFKLILAPGERAEILVDLTGKEGQILTLRQFGTLLPQGYPGGTMMNMGGGNNMMGPLDNTDFNLMNINVSTPTANAVMSIPGQLTTNVPFSSAGATARSFGFSAQPMMSMTNFFINGLKYNMETMNFSTQQGKTEVWTLTNQTMMAHPFHVHGNSFYILSINGATPTANLRGKKDVVTVPPMGGTVKIVTRFDDFSDPDMPYMYHCHILSHEDTGMMGQFVVNPASSATEDLPPDESVRVFPNPITIDNTLVIESDYDVQELDIFDSKGSRVRNYAFSVGKRQTLSLDLANGIYFFQIKTLKGIAMTQVVIQ